MRGGNQAHPAGRGHRGIDLLAAIASSGDLAVTYRGTKPSAAWKGTPAENVLDLDPLSGPAVSFSGRAREAASKDPKNGNVAATLALAGAGFDATRIERVADPAASRNRHAYEVGLPLCRLSVDNESSASGANAKAAVATGYSILSEISRFRNPVVP